MAERSSRGGRSSREYFNAPLSSDGVKGEGRRGRRILSHSRIEEEKKTTVNAPIIMARPTIILAKPKEAVLPEIVKKTEEERKDSEDRISLGSPTCRRVITQPNVPIQPVARPSVSILSSLNTEKLQGGRPAVAAPSMSESGPQMKAAIRLIGDNMDFTDYVLEYLSDSNTNFTVVGAIGPQSTGKSTLLSMLAGNDHQDMYRQYAFRPASREAVESCRFQTSKISVFVTKNRFIFLDCQAMVSSAMLDEFLQLGRRGPLLKASDVCDGNLESQVEIESIQLISFLMQVCHTVLLCVDWFIDVDVIRHVRTSEMLRSTPLPFPGASDAARFKPNRKVNLVVVHQRAKTEDFYPATLNSRSGLLKAMFADSKLKLDSGVSLGGIQRFGLVYSNSDINYIPLADIKPRPKSENQPASGKESLELHDPIVDYEVVIRELRIKLASLFRDTFVVGDQLLSEKQWYLHAMKVLRSTLGNDDIAKYASLLCASDR